MTKEEFRQNAAISALQGVIEAKYGLLLEVADNVAAFEAIRLADALTEEYFKKHPENPYETV